MKNKLFVCEPTLNKRCRKQECYTNGGDCCMTTHKEYESPYISRDFVYKMSPHLASDLLPRTLRGLRERKLKGLDSQELHCL